MAREATSCIFEPLALGWQATWAMRPQLGAFPFAMPNLLTEITNAAKAYYAQAGAFQFTATDFYD